jgi:cyclic lactone autoinducer peptide
MKANNGVVNMIGTVLSKAALSMALTTSNAACFFLSYQPLEPKGLGKFNKK